MNASHVTALSIMFSKMLTLRQTVYGYHILSLKLRITMVKRSGRHAPWPPASSTSDMYK